MKSYGDGIKALALFAVLIGILPLLPAHAQDIEPGMGFKAEPSRTSPLLLSHALERLSKETGFTVLADSTVAYEYVPASVPENALDNSEATVEKKLTALVRSLPPGTVWGKLYLPPPPANRIWKGDDIAAFAFAQARLFGKVGAPSSDGSIELLGKRVGKDAASPYITGLELKPVYLITNTRRQIGEEDAMPWSTASPEQWSKMSREERAQYGQQQAAWIMSLPQQQRDQMLERIRQHDKYFDTVKDPLEKLIGHDL